MVENFIILVTLVSYLSYGCIYSVASKLSNSFIYWLKCRFIWLCGGSPGSHFFIFYFQCILLVLKKGCSRIRNRAFGNLTVRILPYVYFFELAFFMYSRYFLSFCHFYFPLFLIFFHFSFFSMSIFSLIIFGSCRLFFYLENQCSQFV